MYRLKGGDILLMSPSRKYHSAYITNKRERNTFFFYKYIDDNTDIDECGFNGMIQNQFYP